MTTGLPTGSVTGRQDWEWNRLQSDRQSASLCAEPTDFRADERTDPGRRRRSPREARDREVAALRARLERNERHLQAVIDHYEQLLAERNRQLAECGESSDDNLPAVVSDALQWLAD